MKQLRLITVLSLMVITLFTSCNKVKNAPFKQGDYYGTVRVYQNKNLIYESNYELDLDKKTFEGEDKKINNYETKGNYSVDKDNHITFSPYTIQDSSYLNGSFVYQYNKANKRLLLSKNEGDFQYQYDFYLEADN